ncbi:MAG: Mrp/NBP35 family ATP-binding protein [Chloroflexi bacterium]|nr:Mrp/NBP35 family ATP-binding protein [Chloroflexota bacterium]
MGQRIEGVANIVAVASGKGGVGKTTVTVNLALALAQRGARVGIFDADVYGPNVPLMLGVHRQESTRALVPIARASREPYIPPLERYGIKVMSFGLLVGEKDVVLAEQPLVASLVKQTVRDVMWGETDYLLIDLPPGSGEPQQTLVRDVQIDGVVVVTTPQDLSLLDAGRSLGLYRKAGLNVLGVVENMSYLNCPHCGEHVEVFHRSERDWVIEDEQLELLGRVPMDVGISRGIDAGHPLVTASPGSTQAETFRRIARRVEAKLREGT